MLSLAVGGVVVWVRVCDVARGGDSQHIRGALSWPLSIHLDWLRCEWHLVTVSLTILGHLAMRGARRQGCRVISYRGTARHLPVCLLSLGHAGTTHESCSSHPRGIPGMSIHLVARCGRQLPRARPRHIIQSDLTSLPIRLINKKTGILIAGSY